MKSVNGNYRDTTESTVSILNLQFKIREQKVEINMQFHTVEMCKCGS